VSAGTRKRWGDSMLVVQCLVSDGDGGVRLLLLSW
jgi:hypothetical protein